MNANRTTHAAALAVLGTALLLGAPTIASASADPCAKTGPSACVAPPLPAHVDQPQKQVITDPVTTAGTLTSASGRADSKGGNALGFSGDNWVGSIPGSSEAIDIDVYTSGGDHLVSVYANTDSKGHFGDVSTSCLTIQRFSADAYAVAYFHNHPEVRSAPLQLVIATDNKGNYMC